MGGTGTLSSWVYIAQGWVCPPVLFSMLPSYFGTAGTEGLFRVSHIWTKWTVLVNWKLPRLITAHPKRGLKILASTGKRLAQMGPSYLLWEEEYWNFLGASTEVLGEFLLRLSGPARSQLLNSFILFIKFVWNPPPKDQRAVHNINIQKENTKIHNRNAETNQ